MKRAAWLSGLGLSWFVACLPEVTVDDSLQSGGTGGTDREVSPLLGGSGGTAGMGGTANAGSAGSSTGGTAGSGSAGTSGTGGSAGTSDAGASAAGTSGAGGSASTPVPGGMCASTQTREEACADYCQLYFDACFGFQDPDGQDVYTYSGVLDCTDVCTSSVWPVGTISEKGSVLCRCYHAYRALSEGQTPHCYHSAEVPSMEGGCAL